MCYQVDISNQINETNCFLNQYLLPTNKDFFLLFFWINILPSSLLSSYYLLPLACFDMWFRTKCFSMKKIDYAKKTHLSFCLFVCRVGTPLHLVHRRTKKFPFQLQPRWRGVKGGLHVLFFFQMAVWSGYLSQAEKEISVLQSWWHFPRTNISFTSYKQLIQILKFSNDFFVYLLFEYLYKVKVFN